MKLALLSDIHGNFEALKTVLEDIDRHEPEDVVCLGDVVGYGANPSECLALVRERCSSIILGNHDEAAFNPDQAIYFNFHARVAIEWTYRALSDDDRAFLETLPISVTRHDVLCVHSTPRSPKEWEYIIDEIDAREAFRWFTEKFCCIGHSHVPGIYAEKRKSQPTDPDYRALVNVGSVGQPRDQDPRASWCLLDTETAGITINRVGYDIDAAAAKIRRAGLPPQLADRLYKGI